MAKILKYPHMYYVRFQFSCAFDEEDLAELLLCVLQQLPVKTIIIEQVQRPEALKFKAYCAPQ